MLELKSKGIANEVYRLHCAYRNSKIEDSKLAGDQLFFFFNVERIDRMMNMFHNTDFYMCIVSLLKENDPRCVIGNVEKAMTLAQEYRRKIIIA